MSTAAGQHPQFNIDIAAETYDPDEVVPRGSPLMKALHPRLELSPSPPPDIPSSQIRPSSGDSVLVAYLDNGRRPEIARAAGYQGLPIVDEDEQGNAGEDNRPSSPPSCRREGDMLLQSRPCVSAGNSFGAVTGTSLQYPATDVLQAVPQNSRHVPAPRETLDITLSTRHLSLSEDRTTTSTYLLSRQPLDSNGKSDTSNKPPSSMLTPSSSGLPPLQMDSPKSETNGQILPSIRSTLGNIDHISSEPPIPVEKEASALLGSGAHFSRSASETMRRLPPMSTSHVSPPISPNETYQLSLPSSHSLPASRPYPGYTPNGLNQRPCTEYSTSLSSGTPSTEQSAPTPATAISVADRMSIDGITNPSVGLYACRFTGCTAPPFQTQYLLNSHANVHSSARPHYCPVMGCPRSEGGKGFKRKNEMIRHGLVHDSPGYICPFCPDREHKYPRPDNLQRHVRVHHLDKGKDDPLLREVLSQRPDGPNRGRRRRGNAL